MQDLAEISPGPNSEFILGHFLDRSVMTAVSEQIDFHGYLGRASVTTERADLRFYEYDFYDKPNSTPVVLAQFVNPQFVETDVIPLLDTEVELTIFEDRAEINDIYGGRVKVLRGNPVSASHVAYDIDDYAKRASSFNNELERLHVEIRDQRSRNVEAHKLVNELLRRAEIKAGGNQHLRESQASAIAVLERLLRHFENEGR